MSDEIRISMVPVIELNDEIEKQWDLVCESAKESDSLGLIEELSSQIREDWITEMKELKKSYSELCQSRYDSNLISTRVIEKVEYMICGGLGNEASEYEPYQEFSRIEDSQDLCDWLLKVAKAQIFSSSVEWDLNYEPYNADLDGLYSLDTAMADAIVSKQKYLSLGGLSSVSDDVVEILSKHSGGLYLDGLKSLSENAATSLGSHKGELSLEGLTSIDEAVAKSLSVHEGGLWLSGLVEISDSVAALLAAHKGMLFLDGVLELSETAIKSLSDHQGGLALHGLQKISDNSAENLSKCESGPGLGLNGLIELSEAAAKSLAKIDPDKIFLPEELEELVAKYR